jgi:hypothetical protein
MNSDSLKQSIRQYKTYRKIRINRENMELNTIHMKIAVIITCNIDYIVGSVPFGLPCLALTRRSLDS